MSAVLGGCETLMVGAFDSAYAEAKEFSQRLALNTQLILRDEAYFGRVSDPAAGCWYIEWLTDQVARAAWSVFQKNEGEAIISPVAAQRRADVAKRKRSILGVNQFANPKEKAPGPVENSRLAYPFEALRVRMEKKPLKVALLKIGDPKMSRARAEFCANYFACGGFQVQYEADGSDLVVLCSSDPEYPDLAREWVPKLKQPVIVAGYPKDLVDTLKEAGIADFVYLGSDAVETLSRWMTKLGVE
jgi:methylmalonyl-CoA mutase